MRNKTIGKILVPYHIYREHTDKEITFLLESFKRRYCIIRVSEDDLNCNIVLHFNATNEKYKFIKVLFLKETYLSKGVCK